MSTAAQVRTAWQTNVFDHATVTAITSNAVTAEFKELTRKHLEGLIENQEINFFNYLVSRTPQQDQISGAALVLYLYEVEVNYYRESKPDRTNYVTALDAFETVGDRVLSGLGSTWGGTVDFHTLPEEQPEVSEVIINNRECWRVTQTYTAQRRTTI